jgi:hypothetical protein
MRSTSNPINDPQHWRRRAQEARRAADAELKPQIKQKLQRMAQNYDGIAERAEKRAGPPLLTEEK